MYNSGTNALKDLMGKNCAPRGDYRRLNYQMPWKKHEMVSTQVLEAHNCLSYICFVAKCFLCLTYCSRQAEDAPSVHHSRPDPMAHLHLQCQLLCPVQLEQVALYGVSRAPEQLRCELAWQAVGQCPGVVGQLAFQHFDSRLPQQPQWE